MGTIDTVLLLALLPAIYFGIKNGLVRQLVSFAVIYLGGMLAVRFAIPVSGFLETTASGIDVTIPPHWLKIIAFALIFFAAAFVLNLLGRLIERLFKITLLGWLNRLLGVVLSLAIFITVLSLLVYFADSLNKLMDFIPKEKIEESRLYPALLEGANTIFPYLKQLF